MIEHIGTVDKIENGIVIIRITQQPACASCVAKGLCASSEQKEKRIEIECGEYAGLFDPEETVMVIGKTGMAFQSVFLAFILPTLLILATLFVANAKIISDSAAALSATSVLIGYYVVLYFFRNLLKRTLKFTLVKLET